MADRQEGYIGIDNYRIWYRIDGPENPGIPLLVLHGGPGFPHQYLTSLSALAQDRPVIWYDQLGCGNSDTSPDPSHYTLEYYTRELAGVREELNLKTVHILGHSWGTMLACEYYLTHAPTGVRSLILSSPVLSASRWKADQWEYLKALPDEKRTVIIACEEEGRCDDPQFDEAMMLYYQRHVCRLDPMPDCLMESLSRIGQEVYSTMWGRNELSITGSLRGFERAGMLHTIHIPVLFTCGRYDGASPEATMYYHRQVPGSELKICEDASHSHHLEQEEEYNTTIRQFLESVEKT